MRYLLIMLAALSVDSSTRAQILISEYIEGSWANKAIELFNAGPHLIDLSTVELERYSNGSSTPTDCYRVSTSGVATLGPGEVFVVANFGAAASVLNVANATHSIGFFNGDDAIVLKENGTIVDVVGEIGVDPGTAWPVGTGATTNFTLVRNSSVCAGNPAGVRSPAWNSEWIVLPIDTLDNLGTHTSTCLRPPTVLISEYIEGSSSNKAIELTNVGSQVADLSILTLERYTNGATTPTSSYVLSQSGIATLPPGGVFVVANPSASAPILAQADDTNSITFFNGDDAMVLKEDGVIVDVVGTIGIDPGISWVVGTGSTQNFTLIRNSAICSGNRIGANWTNWDREWTVFPIDTTHDVGTHTFTCPPCRNTALTRSFGTSSGLTAPFGPATLSTHRPPRINSIAGLTVVVGNPNPEAGVLLLGLSSSATPLSFAGVDFYVDVTQPTFAIPFMSRMGTTLAWNIRPDPALCSGAPLFFQAFVLDSTTPASGNLPFVATNAVSWTIGD